MKKKTCIPITLGMVKGIFRTLSIILDGAAVNAVTLYFIMLKNGQTYFKNLAVFTPQDF